MYYNRSRSPAPYNSGLSSYSNFSSDLTTRNFSPRNRSIQRVLDTDFVRPERSRSPIRDYTAPVSRTTNYSRPLPSALSGDTSPGLRRKELGLTSDTRISPVKWLGDDFTTKPRSYYDFPTISKPYSSYSNSLIKIPKRTDYSDYFRPAMQSRPMLRSDFIPKPRAERDKTAMPLVRERKLIKFREITNDILGRGNRRVSWDLPEEISSPLIDEMRNKENKVNDEISFDPARSRDSSASRRNSKETVPRESSLTRYSPKEPRSRDCSLTRYGSPKPDPGSPSVSRRFSDHNIDPMSPRNLIRLQSRSKENSLDALDSTDVEFSSHPKMVPPPRKKSLGSLPQIKKRRKSSIENSVVEERSLNYSIIADQIRRSRESSDGATKLSDVSVNTNVSDAPEAQTDISCVNENCIDLISDISNTEVKPDRLPRRRRRTQLGNDSIEQEGRESVKGRRRTRNRSESADASLCRDPMSSSPLNEPPRPTNRMHRKSVKYKPEKPIRRRLSKEHEDDLDEISVVPPEVSKDSFPSAGRKNSFPKLVPDLKTGEERIELDSEHKNENLPTQSGKNLRKAKGNDVVDAQKNVEILNSDVKKINKEKENAKTAVSNKICSINLNSKPLDSDKSLKETAENQLEILSNKAKSTLGSDTKIKSKNSKATESPTVKSDVSNQISSPIATVVSENLNSKNSNEKLLNKNAVSSDIEKIKPSKSNAMVENINVVQETKANNKSNDVVKVLPILPTSNSDAKKPNSSTKADVKSKLIDKTSINSKEIIENTIDCSNEKPKTFETVPVLIKPKELADKTKNNKMLSESLNTLNSTTAKTDKNLKTVVSDSAITDKSKLSSKDMNVKLSISDNKLSISHSQNAVEDKPNVTAKLENETKHGEKSNLKSKVHNNSDKIPEIKKLPSNDAVKELPVSVTNKQNNHAHTEIVTIKELSNQKSSSDSSKVKVNAKKLDSSITDIKNKNIPFDSAKTTTSSKLINQESVSLENQTVSDNSKLPTKSFDGSDHFARKQMNTTTASFPSDNSSGVSNNSGNILNSDVAKLKVSKDQKVGITFQQDTKTEKELAKDEEIVVVCKLPPKKPLPSAKSIVESTVNKNIPGDLDVIVSIVNAKTVVVAEKRPGHETKIARDAESIIPTKRTLPFSKIKSATTELSSDINVLNKNQIGRVRGSVSVAHTVVLKPKLSNVASSSQQMNSAASAVRLKSIPDVIQTAINTSSKATPQHNDFSIENKADSSEKSFIEKPPILPSISNKLPVEVPDLMKNTEKSSQHQISKSNKEDLLVQESLTHKVKDISIPKKTHVETSKKPDLIEIKNTTKDLDNKVITELKEKAPCPVSKPGSENKVATDKKDPFTVSKPDPDSQVTAEKKEKLPCSVFKPDQENKTLDKKEKRPSDISKPDMGSKATEERKEKVASSMPKPDLVNKISTDKKEKILNAISKNEAESKISTDKKEKVPNAISKNEAESKISTDKKEKVPCIISKNEAESKISTDKKEKVPCTISKIEAESKVSEEKKEKAPCAISKPDLVSKISTDKKEKAPCTVSKPDVESKISSDKKEKITCAVPKPELENKSIDKNKPQTSTTKPQIDEKSNKNLISASSPEVKVYNTKINLTKENDVKKQINIVDSKKVPDSAKRYKRSLTSPDVLIAFQNQDQNPAERDFVSNTVVSLSSGCVPTTLLEINKDQREDEINLLKKVLHGKSKNDSSNDQNKNKPIHQINKPSSDKNDVLPNRSSAIPPPESLHIKKSNKNETVSKIPPDVINTEINSNKTEKIEENKETNKKPVLNNEQSKSVLPAALNSNITTEKNKKTEIFSDKTPSVAVSESSAESIQLNQKSKVVDDTKKQAHLLHEKPKIGVKTESKEISMQNAMNNHSKVEPTKDSNVSDIKADVRIPKEESGKQSTGTSNSKETLFENSNSKADQLANQVKSNDTFSKGKGDTKMSATTEISKKLTGKPDVSCETIPEERCLEPSNRGQKLDINGNSSNAEIPENQDKSSSIINNNEIKSPVARIDQPPAISGKKVNNLAVIDENAITTKTNDKSVKTKPVSNKKPPPRVNRVQPKIMHYGLRLTPYKKTMPESSDSDSSDTESSLTSSSSSSESESESTRKCLKNAQLKRDKLPDRDDQKSTRNQTSNSSIKSTFSTSTRCTTLSTSSTDDSPKGPKKLRFKKYEIDDFVFLKLLGKGSFGKVLLAELKGHDMYFAIKCLKKDVVLEDDDVESTMIERRVLALGTQHPYMCKLYCTFQTNSYLFFVMEYLNGGDLMFHIQAERQFDLKRAMFYSAEIVSALKFLHKRGIVYRDIKLDNVVLDKDGHIRLVDFGMCQCRVYNDESMPSNFCGTPTYIAPEIILGQTYNQSVDWWSLGVLLFEMLAGRSPFVGTDEDELYWSICNEEPSYPHFLSKDAKNILENLLLKSPVKRLGMPANPTGDIKDHPFFSTIQWEKLERKEIPPPFKPTVASEYDTRNFDSYYTTDSPSLSPVDDQILASMDQEQFQGFSYTNPHITG